MFCYVILTLPLRGSDARNLISVSSRWALKSALHTLAIKALTREKGVHETAN